MTNSRRHEHYSILRHISTTHSTQFDAVCRQAVCHLDYIRESHPRFTPVVQPVIAIIYSGDKYREDAIDIQSRLHKKLPSYVQAEFYVQQGSAEWMREDGRKFDLCVVLNDMPESSFSDGIVETFTEVRAPRAMMLIIDEFFEVASEQTVP